MNITNITNADESLDAMAIDDFDVDLMIATRVTGRDVVELPLAVARVNEAVADGASVGEVTRLVELDPGLGANIARLARSAAFTGAVGEKISVPYAVMRLGVQGVRAVCLTSSLAKVGLRPGPLIDMRRRLWRECLASALTCQAMAAFRGVSADDAYLLGLLHDFGKVVALSVVEGDVATSLPTDTAFWSDIAERHHCDVGWIVTEAWRLPEAIPSVTATHHLPSTGVLLHDLVVCADDVVATAAGRGWQISAEDIEAIDGVRTRDEAMAVRIALARHPYYLAAIG